MPVAWFGSVSLWLLRRCSGSLSYFHVGRPAQVVVCRADHVAVLLHQAQFFLLRQVVQLLYVLLAILVAAQRAIGSFGALSFYALDCDFMCFGATRCEALWREGPYSELG